MSARPIFYDTETTGVRAEHDRIVEIAAYDPVQDRTFCQLVNPGCPIPPEATAIHHISNEMVANAPPFAQVAEQFVQFCEGNVILLAHNNDAFDLHFLRHEFGRNQGRDRQAFRRAAGGTDRLARETRSGDTGRGNGARLLTWRSRYEAARRG